MAEPSESIDKGEIEELLRQAKGAAAQSPGAVPDGVSEVRPGQIDAQSNGGGDAPPQTSAPGPIPAVQVPQERTPDQTNDDIQLLLEQAEQAIASVEEPGRSNTEALPPFQFKELAGSAPSEEKASLDLIRDVELDLRIELGRTEMLLEDVLKLRRGSVVALDKLAGDPVDVFVNGRLVARGEVLVLNDNFCVRVAELISGEEPH